MANSNAPRGFIPTRTYGSAPFPGALERCYRPSSDANNLFINDPVDLGGTGDTVGMAPTVVRATAGSGGYVYGTVVSVENDTSDNLSRSYLPASTAGYVMVLTDPNAEFEIQENGNMGITAIGLNVDFSFSTAGNTTTGMSGCQLASSGADTTNTLQCRVIGVANRVDNEVGTNAKWRVRFNLRRAFNTTGA